MLHGASHSSSQFIQISAFGFWTDEMYNSRFPTVVHLISPKAQSAFQGDTLASQSKEGGASHSPKLIEDAISTVQKRSVRLPSNR